MHAVALITRTCSSLAFSCAFVLHAQGQTSASAVAPDSAMMAPVTTLARYMAHVEGAALPGVFADSGVVIVEDFAPYIFNGPNASARWNAGYRRHASRLTHLKCGFGPAHDFDRTGDRVYFVLPTTWTGAYLGERFEEHGAWSFVLTRMSGQWRIIAYGWGATDRRDFPSKQ